MFAGKKSAQIREILISESAWEEMTCLFAPSLILGRCSRFTSYYRIRRHVRKTAVFGQIKMAHFTVVNAAL
ncbi:hypothetical protein FHQ73_06715 [Escherichia coli]|nr:hypothetical protein [Escherichia coli]